MKLQFRLNGKETNIEAPSDRRVIDLLREDLGLTGAKEGCSAGDCGACAILVDGRSRLSCLTMAAQIQGKELITIEGLQKNDTLHPLQRSFVEKGAIQCGFCTPGMVLASVDLLKRNPAPTREEIRQGLSGALCRCTGYQKIVDAVEKAASLIGGDELN